MTDEATEDQPAAGTAATLTGHCRTALGGGAAPRLPPDRLDAVLFDLEGVLTDTASLHEAASTEVFGELFEQAVHGATGLPAPLTGEDCRLLVGGKPRLDGVRDVLADRHIALPVGSPADPPGMGSASAVAAAEDARFAALLRQAGVRPFPGAVTLLERLRGAGVATAVVSAGRHCADVLSAAGLDSLLDARIDDSVAVAMGLPGRPDSATFVEAVARLGADPARSAVVAAAPAGVMAARRGGFGLVIGIDRHGSCGGRRSACADLVAGHRARRPATALTTRVPISPTCTTGWPATSRAGKSSTRAS